MTEVIYDGTYEGWLTAVFEIYEYKLTDIVFAKNETSGTLLFADSHLVITDISKAKRVLEGLSSAFRQKAFQIFIKHFYLNFLK